MNKEEGFKEALIKVILLTALTDKDVAKTLFDLSGNVSSNERRLLNQRLTEQIEAHLVTESDI